MALSGLLPPHPPAPGLAACRPHRSRLCLQVTPAASCEPCWVSASSSWQPTSPSRYACTPCPTWTSFWGRAVSHEGPGRGCPGAAGPGESRWPPEGLESLGRVGEPQAPRKGQLSLRGRPASPRPCLIWAASECPATIYIQPKWPSFKCPGNRCWSQRTVSGQPRSSRAPPSPIFLLSPLGQRDWAEGPGPGVPPAQCPAPFHPEDGVPSRRPALPPPLTLAPQCSDDGTLGSPPHCPVGSPTSTS